jgi:hypothetical protein
MQASSQIQVVQEEVEELQTAELKQALMVHPGKGIKAATVLFSSTHFLAMFTALAEEVALVLPVLMQLVTVMAMAAPARNHL